MWHPCMAPGNCLRPFNPFGFQITFSVVIEQFSQFSLKSKDFKRVIKQRQRAFSSGNSIAFNFYRNKANKMRKSCCAKYYSSKVEHLKQLKPKEWWREAKRLCGITPVSNSPDLIFQLQLENTDHLELSPLDLANLINNSFVEPMKTFSGSWMNLQKFYQIPSPSLPTPPT